MAPILKRSSLAVGIETFGARYHICFGTLSRTFVVLSNHGTAPVGEDISRYNSWFCVIFPWTMLQDGVNKVDCSATSILATARRIYPYHNRYFLGSCNMGCHKCELHKDQTLMHKSKVQMSNANNRVAIMIITKSLPVMTTFIDIECQQVHEPNPCFSVHHTGATS